MPTKRINLFSFLPIALLFLLLGASKPPPQNAVTIATHLYEAGDYAGAAQLLSQLAEEGWESADLYANIASSYAAQEDVGHALLYYERALRLTPRDSDLRAERDELRQAQQLPTPLIWSWRDWLSADELTTLALIAWIGLLLTLWYGRRRQTRYGSLLIITSLSLLLTLSLLLATQLQEQRHPPAIIVEHNTPLYPAPLTQDALLRLPAGTTVTLEETRPQWISIAYNGMIGWVNESAVTKIAP